MPITMILAGQSDIPLFDNVANDVFDNAIRPQWLAEFLADSRHHIAVALDGGQMVGFASAVHYIHPDKPPEFWVNEVGVAPSHQRQGIGRRLLEVLFERARELNCEQGWVLTEQSNAAARRLYVAAGGVEQDEDTLMVSFRFPKEP